MKKLQLELTTLAKNELLDVFDFSCERWGEKQAIKYITGLHRALEVHLKNPLSFSKEEPELAEALGFEPNLVRSFLYEKHRCYFYTSQNSFRVLSIIHSARDKEKSYYRIKQETQNS